MLTGRQGVKYAGKDIEAMSAIASAATRRSLKEFKSVTDEYPHELQDDLLIKHHLHILHEQLLESNLVCEIQLFFWKRPLLIGTNLVKHRFESLSHTLVWRYPMWRI